MGERLTAMVATSSPPVVEPEAVRRSLRQFLPASDGEPFFAEGDPKEKQSLVVTVAGVVIAVMALPFPIPAETLAPAVDSELVWKEAAGTFLAAKGHVLVSVVNPARDAAERFDQARVLTAVTAAIVATANGTGVLWQSAASVIPPERFVSEATDLRDEAPNRVASALWFSFRFFPGSRNPQSELLICQSTGLSAFLAREIECGPYAMTPYELWLKVLLAARYMAGAGPVFADGDTLGLAGTEKPDARIHFDSSSRGGVDKPIFQLRLLDQGGLRGNAAKASPTPGPVAGWARSAALFLLMNAAGAAAMIAALHFVGPKAAMLVFAIWIGVVLHRSLADPPQRAPSV